MKRQQVGQIYELGLKPRNVRIIVSDDDPLTYKLRHIPVSSSSGTLTLDLGEANSFSIDLTENITTIDIDGPMVSGQYWDFHLDLTQDATARTVAWANKYLFPGGTAHVMSTGSGEIDSVYGYTIDGGTTYRCTFENDYSLAGTPPALSVSISPTSISSTSPSCPLTSATITGTGSGGAGGYSYAWDWASGGTGLTINSPTSRTTTLTTSGPGEKTGSLRCTVTDTALDTATDTITISMECGGV